MRDSDRLSPQQKQDRRARRGKRAPSMVLSEPSAFVPARRRLSPDTAKARLVRRVRRRRELEGADWLKQMRRQQRNQSEARPPRTPEQKIAVALMNKDELDGEGVRYKALPTPEQLDATRIKDTRSSKR